MALAVVAVAACELVLGELPPVEQSSTGAISTSGAGGHSTGSSSSATTSVTSATSATSASSSSSTGGPCCDCDGDHFAAEGMCGGNDCDDSDPLVYPGEPMYYGKPAKNAAIGFDYDCSGTADPNPQLNTTVDCGLVGLPCTAKTGFLAQVPPACGDSAPWGTCKQQGLGCVQDVQETAKVMTCK